MNNKHFWMKQFIHRIVYTCNYLVVQKWYTYNFKIISLMISNNIVQKEHRWSLMIYFFIPSGDGLKTLMMQLRMKSCSKHIWMRFCMPTNLCWFLFLLKRSILIISSQSNEHNYVNWTPDGFLHRFVHAPARMYKDIIYCNG